MTQPRKKKKQKMKKAKMKKAKMKLTRRQRISQHLRKQSKLRLPLKPVLIRPLTLRKKRKKRQQLQQLQLLTV